MKQVTKEVLKELCEKNSIKEDSLTFLGGGREDSDGIAYSFISKGKKKVLKILSIPEEDVKAFEKIKVRVRYANFLGENGIQLAYPIMNENDNLYETSKADKFIYTTYIMDYFDGTNPKSEELTDEIIRDWGQLTGKMHQVNRKFDFAVSEQDFGYQSEIEFMTEWCKDPVVKEHWSMISDEFAKHAGLD